MPSDPKYLNFLEFLKDITTVLAINPLYEFGKAGRPGRPHTDPPSILDASSQRAKPSIAVKLSEALSLSS